MACQVQYHESTCASLQCESCTCRIHGCLTIWVSCAAQSREKNLDRSQSCVLTLGRLTVHAVLVVRTNGDPYKETNQHTRGNDISLSVASEHEGNVVVKNGANQLDPFNVILRQGSCDRAGPLER